MGGDERNPDDVAKQAVIGAFVFFLVAVSFLWGVSQLIAYIKGYPQVLL